MHQSIVVVTLFILVLSVLSQNARDQTLRPRQVKRPDGLYLPPHEEEEDIQPGGFTPTPTTTGVPNESEEDIQPGGYTPAPTPTTTGVPNESEEVILPGGYTPPPSTTPPPPPQKTPPKQQIGSQAPSGESWGGGEGFGFEYGVKDEKSGNDYSHVQTSDGDVVKGEYRTLMADGRIQVVTYTADWKNGYRAIVRYYPYNNNQQQTTKS